MSEPSFEEIRKTAESIRTRRGFYIEAVRFKDQALERHIQALPPNLRDRFTGLNMRYYELLGDDADKDEKGNPRLKSLKTYYRKAARRFHPDTKGCPDKVALFREATEAYEKNDLRTLQVLVLQDLSEEIDGLPESDKNFLIAEYGTMVNVAEEMWKITAETVIAAGNLESMSENMFRLEAEEACGQWAKEIGKMETLGKERQTPSLLEGK